MSATQPKNVDPSSIPVVPPPPGVESNFDNPEDRGYQLWTVAMLCIALVIPCVAVRLFTRLRITKNLGWDDYLIIFSTLCLLPVVGVNLYMTTYFYGKHMWDLRYVDNDSVHNVTCVMAQYLVYLLSSISVRLSILLLYLRLFNTQKAVKFAIYGTAIFVVLYNVSVIISYTVSVCYSPIFHPSTEVDAEAISNYVKEQLLISQTHAGFNVASDLLLMLLPIQPIRHLKLSSKAKLRVGLVFLTGSIALICAIIGLIFRLSYGNVTDASWSAVNSMICIICELSVGIICSCMPSLAKFFREVFHRGDTTTASRTGKSTYGYGCSGPRDKYGFDMGYGSGFAGTTAATSKSYPGHGDKYAENNIYMDNTVDVRMERLGDHEISNQGRNNSTSCKSDGMSDDVKQEV